MAVLGNDDEIYGVKRKWQNREFSSCCSNKPKFKQRKVSARRDFPKGFTKNLSPKVENVKSDYEPEKLEDVLSQPIFEPPEKLEDDALSQSICEPPEILYSRNDYPVVFYHVPRKVFAKRDFPEAFYANSSHFVRRVEREESESEAEELEEAIGSDDDDKRDFPEAFYANSSHFVRRVEREGSESEAEELEEMIGSDDDDKSESELEELEEAIGSDDDDKSESELEEAIGSDDYDKTEESKCESYNDTKAMGFEEYVNNHIVGSTKILDLNRMMSGAGEERGDYVQHMLAFLDHMKATLMQKYSRNVSAL